MYAQVMDHNSSTPIRVSFFRHPSSCPSSLVPNPSVCTATTREASATPSGDLYFVPPKKLKSTHDDKENLDSTGDLVSARLEDLRRKSKECLQTLNANIVSMERSLDQDTVALKNESDDNDHVVDDGQAKNEPYEGTEAHGTPQFPVPEHMMVQKKDEEVNDDSPVHTCFPSVCSSEYAFMFDTPVRKVKTKYPHTTVRLNSFVVMCESVNRVLTLPGVFEWEKPFFLAKL